MKYIIVLMVLLVTISCSREEKFYSLKPAATIFDVSTDLEEILKKDSIKIDLSSYGCERRWQYRIVLSKESNQYKLAYYIEPRKRFDICDDGFKDLSDSLILHNKFTLTTKDLNIIKKVMIPGENERSTSSYYWTVKYANQKIECNQKGGERWGILKEYLEMNHCNCEQAKLFTQSDLEEYAKFEPGLKELLNSQSN